MTRVLVTGANGFLGAKMRTLFATAHEVIGTYSSRPQEGLAYLDITNREQTITAIRDWRPEVIIHTAAFSNADKCERDPETAGKINTEGTANVAAGAYEAHSRLVFTSSAYVFDGRQGDYSEEDVPCPLNVLGKTKLAAEEAILSTLGVRERYLILRFAISYGYNGPGYDNGFFGEIMKRKPLRVNHDQLRQPLLIDDLAVVISGLLEREVTGIVHVAGPEKRTKYELGGFLEDIVREHTEPSLLTPGTSEDDFAPRPTYGTLQTGKLLEYGMHLRSVAEGITIVRSQLPSHLSF
ncbi:NAD(P)-dependent oxidoreductase [Candidatus Woesearchaeota archaeon]|nr:NAD(P)-dependent oxidoreductase [Candidatus Woesearchaeota archaeon]